MLIQIDHCLDYVYKFHFLGLTGRDDAFGRFSTASSNPLLHIAVEVRLLVSRHHLDYHPLFPILQKQRYDLRRDNGVLQYIISNELQIALKGYFENKFVKFLAFSHALLVL